MLAWLAARATSLAMLRTATIPKNAKTTAKPMTISLICVAGACRPPRLPAGGQSAQRQRASHHNSTKIRTKFCFEYLQSGGRGCAGSPDHWPAPQSKGCHRLCLPDATSAGGMEAFLQLLVCKEPCCWECRWVLAVTTWTRREANLGIMDVNARKLLRGDHVSSTLGQKTPQK
jgi:hypothetical protein